MFPGVWALTVSKLSRVLTSPPWAKRRSPWRTRYAPSLAAGWIRSVTLSGQSPWHVTLDRRAPNGIGGRAAALPNRMPALAMH
jgi:hypothetical protein